MHSQPLTFAVAPARVGVWLPLALPSRQRATWAANACSFRRHCPTKRSSVRVWAWNVTGVRAVEERQVEVEGGEQGHAHARARLDLLLKVSRRVKKSVALRCIWPSNSASFQESLGIED